MLAAEGNDLPRTHPEVRPRGWDPGSGFERRVQQKGFRSSAGKTRTKTRKADPGNPKKQQQKAPKETAKVSAEVALEVESNWGL